MNVKNQLAYFRNKLFGVNAVLYEIRNLSNQVSRLSVEIDAAIKASKNPALPPLKAESLCHPDTFTPAFLHRRISIEFVGWIADRNPCPASILI